MEVVDIDARAAKLGIDWSQVNFDSIQLPPGEDFGIESDDEAVYQDDQSEFDTGFGNIIVVDHLPVVPKEKFEKLEGVVKKIYNQLGVIKENGLWMPVDPDTKMTLGYCFIEFNTPQEAQNAKEKSHGYKLDKSHIFAVNMFDDFDRLMNVKEEWEPPQARPYVPGENLQKWLTDEKARDQLVIRSGPDTEVFWNDTRQKAPEPVHKRPVSYFLCVYPFCLLDCLEQCICYVTFI